MVFINGSSPTAEMETASADQLSASAERSGGLHLEPTVRRIPIATSRMQVGPIDETVSLNDMLDCCIMYYHAVAHKYVVVVRTETSPSCMAWLLCIPRPITLPHDRQTEFGIWSKNTPNERIVQNVDRHNGR